MTQEFVPYEQALELKELGFDEPCFTHYFNDNGQIRTGLSIHINNGWTYSGTKRLETTLAPLYQQAFRWFREKYGLYTEFFISDDKTFSYMITSFIEEGRLDRPIRRGFITYEEAELDCIIKLIEIVKNK